MSEFSHEIADECSKTDNLNQPVEINPDHVAARRMALFFESANSAQITNIVTSAFVCGMVYFFTDPIILLAWAIAMMCTSAFRKLVTIWASRRSYTENTNARFAYLMSSTIVGILWGLTPFMLEPGVDAIVVIAVVFMIAGMTAGAATYSAAFIPAGIAFNAPAISLLATYFLMNDPRPIEYAMCAVLLVYYFATMRLAKIVSKFVDSSIVNEMQSKIAAAKIEHQADALRELATKHEVAANQAKAAADAKAAFLANVSHEIRTPMNGVLGMLSALEGTELNKEQRNYVKVANRSGEGLLRIINDVLDFSKLENNRIELNPAPFAPRDTLELIRDSLGPSAAEKGVFLALSIADAIPKHLVGDETRFRQVMFNLVGNAVKFTDKGSVSIEVHNIKTDDTHCQMKIMVNDTGIGIPQEKIDRLFNRFEQAHGAADVLRGGAGLGLAISHEIIALMGSEIVVTSVEGEGSSFAFILEMEIAQEIKIEEEQLSIETGRYKILIAEDNHVNRLVVKSMLSKFGHELTFAVDGQEAVEMAAIKEYDLILMDVQMPKMNGFDAAKEIRLSEGLNKSTPILALTALSNRDSEISAYHAGMQGVSPKPLRVRQITRAIETAVSEGVSEGAFEAIARENTGAA